MFGSSGKGRRSTGSGKEESIDLVVSRVEVREEISCGDEEFGAISSALMDERKLFSFHPEPDGWSWCA